MRSSIQSWLLALTSNDSCSYFLCAFLCVISVYILSIMKMIGDALTMRVSVTGFLHLVNEGEIETTISTTPWNIFSNIQSEDQS